jgi:outer membrane protein OmpA-like peptidoglycan-associated protein/tRNA(Ser,Leu) C12 N-acetylase TAN1
MKKKLILFIITVISTAIFANDYPISEPEPDVSPELVVEQPESDTDHELIVNQAEPVVDFEPIIRPKSPFFGPGLIAEQETAIAAVVSTAEFRSLLVRVEFEHDSAEPSTASSVELDSIAAYLQQNAHFRYEVHGHSCADVEGVNRGLRFSVQRVEAMVYYLRANGVPITNIVTIINPVASEITGGECVDDRRVDIMLVERRQIEPESIVEPEQIVIPEPESIVVFEPMPELMPESEPIVLPPSLESLALEQGKTAVAIYMAGEEPVEARGVHNILGGELARILSESDSYLAVDRTEAILEQLAREHIYQRSGAVDDDQIKALGQQLGVQYLCISNINAVGRRFYLDTRLVDVVTAEIIRSVTATSRLRNADEMARVARNIALELIETERTLEQRARRKKMLRYTAIGLDVLGAGALIYGYYENSNIKNFVDDGEYPNAERVVPKRNAAYIVGGALLATGISFHIFL